jgi:hypothetical protein
MEVDKAQSKQHMPTPTSPSGTDNCFMALGWHDARDAAQHFTSAMRR